MPDSAFRKLIDTIFKANWDPPGDHDQGQPYVPRAFTPPGGSHQSKIKRPFTTRHKGIVGNSLTPSVKHGFKFTDYVPQFFCELHENYSSLDHANYLLSLLPNTSSTNSLPQFIIWILAMQKICMFCPRLFCVALRCELKLKDVDSDSEVQPPASLHTASTAAERAADDANQGADRHASEKLRKEHAAIWAKYNEQITLAGATKDAALAAHAYETAEKKAVKAAAVYKVAEETAKAEAETNANTIAAEANANAEELDRAIEPQGQVANIPRLVSIRCEVAPFEGSHASDGEQPVATASIGNHSEDGVARQAMPSHDDNGRHVRDRTVWHKQKDCIPYIFVFPRFFTPRSVPMPLR
ncbi:hypothetical protein DFJ58DRAFT_730847 [Suillus subalutaceus]|uniref:uncharacterized protein n=1 Tax=Suillus subalutaceus TaxID=48586 RepID=UPI001B87824C|nr:uncharacterized protein DFJ58DRAFT_730847 [Suillus subalutaceus]KAG1845500.1 hypothetical protein DFJ58DRAFT_730847 [Suillus subalutaceus]